MEEGRKAHFLFRGASLFLTSLSVTLLEDALSRSYARVDAFEVIVCQRSFEAIGHCDVIIHLIHKVLVKLHEGLFFNIRVHCYHLPF
jgi:hypothetical protein